MTAMTDGEARFWELAEPLLARPGVTRSTMMGLPCLRVNEAFFASCDRRSGDLLVKLPADRVAELVAAGRAHVRAGRAALPGVGSRAPRAQPQLAAPARRRSRLRRWRVLMPSTRHAFPADTLAFLAGAAAGRGRRRTRTRRVRDWG
jgi:hypothetical protein